VVSVKYRLFAQAAEWLGALPTGQVAENDALAPA